MPGNDTDPPPINREPIPEDAFALVGHELRTEILQVLRAEGELSFSELRANLDTELDPSQLHYHLQQLVGHFVEKNNSSYELHARGYRLCEVLRAGTFDRRQEQLTVDAGFDCYHCQTPMEVIFDNGRVRSVCSDCGTVYVADFLDISLAAFEDAAAAFSYFSKYTACKTFLSASGVCPSCAHPLSPTFRSLAENPRPHKVVIIQSCNICGASWDHTVGMALVTDSGLRSFCYDHGVDIISTPHWELEFAATDKHVTVRSTDPWEIALEVTFDGNTLELVVDGDLNVVERNIMDGSDMDEVVLPTKADCMQSLRQHRWPDAVMCPHCDSRDTTKEGTTRKAAQSYRCHNCGSIFNDLTGTIFAGRGLSASEMCYIIQEMEETETVTIARHLGRSYKPVLEFVHAVQDLREKDAQYDPSSICPTNRAT